MARGEESTTGRLGSYLGNRIGYNRGRDQKQQIKLGWAHPEENRAENTLNNL